MERPASEALAVQAERPCLELACQALVCLDRRGPSRAEAVQTVCRWSAPKGRGLAHRSRASPTTRDRAVSRAFLAAHRVVVCSPAARAARVRLHPEDGSYWANRVSTKAHRAAAAPWLVDPAAPVLANREHRPAWDRLPQPTAALTRQALAVPLHQAEAPRSIRWEYRTTVPPVTPRRAGLDHPIRLAAKAALRAAGPAPGRSVCRVAVRAAVRAGVPAEDMAPVRAEEAQAQAVSPVPRAGAAVSVVPPTHK